MRQQIGERLAAQLYSAETAIDVALRETAGLAALLPQARADAYLSATTGQRAFDGAAGSIRSLTEARGQLVDAHRTLAALARRLRRTNENLADLVFTDVPGRVAKALLDLADRFGRTADDRVHVHHDLTQEELAQLVGASRETVNKALADFASRGWLRLEPRSVVIMDVERLRRRAR